MKHIKSKIKTLIQRTKDKVLSVWNRWAYVWEVRKRLKQARKDKDHKTIWILSTFNRPLELVEGREDKVIQLNTDEGLPLLATDDQCYDECVPRSTSLGGIIGCKDPYGFIISGNVYGLEGKEGPNEAPILPFPKETIYPLRTGDA